MTSESSGSESEAARRREALDNLERLRHEGGTFAGSALTAGARRAADHFAAREPGGAAGATDRIELWGRRIGRALSAAGFMILCVYLYLTYVR